MSETYSSNLHYHSRGSRKKRGKKLWNLAFAMLKASRQVSPAYKWKHKLAYNKALLTHDEKLMYRDPSVRTSEERKRLVRYFVQLEALECFSPKVRARLSRVALLMMLEPGRLIIKKGTNPTGVYFLLSGSVACIIRDTDLKTKDVLELMKHSLLLTPGTCFGALELIEGYKKRVESYRAATDVKLIFVYEDDYNAILKKEMTNCWETKKEIINGMQHFDFLTPKEKQDVCKIGKLRQYAPNDLIHDGSQVFHQDNAYFVVCGIVVVVDRLRLKSKKPTAEQPEPVELLTADDLMRIHKLNKSESIETIVSSESLESIDLLAYEKPNAMQLVKVALKKYNMESCLNEQEIKLLTQAFEERKKIVADVLVSTKYNELKKTPKKHYEFTTNAFSSNSMISSHSSNQTNDDDFFMDVCSITANGMFGLGERATERFFYSRTAVKCLVVPRHWLFRLNNQFVWGYRKLVLNHLMPDSESIRENHLKDLKWPSLKRKLLLNIFGEETPRIACHLEDVPVMGLIENGFL